LNATMQTRPANFQNGSVLIVTLVVLSLISAMAGRIVYQARLELRIQQHVNALTALRALARGGAHQFASFLRVHVEDSSNGPPAEWWTDTTALQAIGTESAEVVIYSGTPSDVEAAQDSLNGDTTVESSAEDEPTEHGLVDAESRLNINTATQEQFMGFPGFSNILAEEIVRYREELSGTTSDEDEQAVAEESSDSQSEDNSPVQYVGTPFRSIDDLLAVPDMTEEILYGHVQDIDGAPADFLTCCSNGKINLNTAPHPVLVAAGFSPEEANVLAAERRSGRLFKDLSISGSVLPEIDEERWTRLLKSITVRSSTFPVTIHASNTRNDQKLGLFARIFLRESDAQFVSWKEI
tara:strand:- start:3027 stop:4082 length:1056 start_codon:yes stop_codon:yes gene_type:complete